jgi:Tol biopolymer transport system component
MFLRKFAVVGVFSVVALGEAAYAASDPAVFAEGVISTGKEFTVAFTPDGNSVYFTRADVEHHVSHVMRSRRVNGVWQAAERVSFSDDHWSDLDPAISPDGRRLFFVSTRPVAGKDPSKRDMDIWVSRRSADDWGTPEHIDAVNSTAKEGSPTVDRKGNLYFFSDRGAQPNTNSIYMSRYRHGRYESPVKLGANINTGPSDTSPSISPDGRTMLFYSTRTGGNGKADIYISYFENGAWRAADNVGAPVNTEGFEYNPTISPDGKTLYFGRDRKIYSIPVSELRVNRLDRAWK